MTKQLNPAKESMTAAQSRVYKIILARQQKGETTKTSDVAKSWGGKNRQYVRRIIVSLMDKGIVESYTRIYYRIANAKENTHGG